MHRLPEMIALFSAMDLHSRELMLALAAQYVKDRPIKAAGPAKLKLIIGSVGSGGIHPVNDLRHSHDVLPARLVGATIDGN